MLCYPASKVVHAETWKALRAALAPSNVHIRAAWLDWELQDHDDKTAEQWQHHWETNIVPDVLACDCLIFMSLAGERACSALIEVGLAMAHGKRIMCISPDWWSFSCHGNVRCYPNLEAAVGSLVASAAGARLRAA
jgi:Nucleoside 2-deoxyribosyltransferase